MLVLSRETSEQIIINHNIVITIVQVRGNVVRVGIDAPREVPVHRAEIEQEVVRQGRSHINLFQGYNAGTAGYADH